MSSKKKPTNSTKIVETFAAHQNCARKHGKAVRIGAISEEAQKDGVCFLCGHGGSKRATYKVAVDTK